MDLIGKTLGGCKVTGLIGKGAMGEVYRATQLSLEREVAIKILAQHYAEDEEFRLRFIREARSIAKVNHPNILQIYEVAEQDGINFMVMELINGQTMADILQKKGFIEWHVAAEFAKQAAMGLQSAAEANIIHRDIKPDNLMVTNNGIVKVSDFGLAKECNSELTQTNTVMGTPAYMSPEQCDGEDLNTLTDIYSLGATLYRIVTGVLPFTAPTAVSMMYKHKHEEPVPPEKYMPSLPKPLSKLILAMMEKDRDNRPQNMGLIADELDNIIKNVPVTDSSEMTMKVDKGNDSFGFDAAPAKAVDDFMINPADELIAESEMFMKQKRPIAAYNCLKRALELQPDNTKIRQKLEKAKEESTVASIKISEQLLEHGKLSHIRAELHEKIKKDPDDVDSMEKLQALDFMDQQKRNMTNDIRKKLGAENYEEALQLWEKMPEHLREKSLVDTINHIKQKVLPLQAVLIEAEKLNNDGNLEGAIAKLDEAAAIDNTDQVMKIRQQVNQKLNTINTLLREGAESEINGDLKNAVDCYGRILGILPEHKKAAEKRIDCLKMLANQASSKGELQEAEKLLEELLTIDPKNSEAGKKLGEIKNHNKELKEYLSRSTTALSKKNYLAAIKSSKKALEMAPSHQSAVFKLKEAKRGLIYKRLMPLTIVAVIVLAVAAIAPKFYLDMLLNSADKEITAKNYEKAKQLLSTAQKIPFWATQKNNVITSKINQINITTILENFNSAYENALKNNDEKNRKIFFDSVKETEKQIKDMPTLPEKIKGSHIADIYLKEAGIIYKSGDMEKSFEKYNNYLLFAKTSNIPASMEAKNKVLGISAWKQGNKFMETGKLESAEFHFQTAVQKLPELTQAKEALEKIKTKKTRFIKMIESAREKIVDARKEKIYSNYKLKLEQAKEAAEKVLAEKPDNTEAKNIIREVDWRLDAGKDMVFFMLSPDKAFAIDRYEYPNKKGEKPLSASFFEARELAKKAGKKLPDIDTWRTAALGVKRRDWDYTWGNKFREKHCQASTNSPKDSAAESGSFPQGATPEGVEDMCGNLAEWVDAGETEGADEATAMGGCFTDTDPFDLTVNTMKTYSAKINYRSTGFRCVKFYNNKE